MCIRDRFATSFKNETIAIDGPSGRPMWTREKGGAGGLGLASGSVVVSDPTGTVWALDKTCLLYTSRCV